jgi:hypothetical protein
LPDQVFISPGPANKWRKGFDTKKNQGLLLADTVIEKPYQVI